MKSGCSLTGCFVLEFLDNFWGYSHGEEKNEREREREKERERARNERERERGESFARRKLLVPPLSRFPSRTHTRLARLASLATLPGAASRYPVLQFSYIKCTVLIYRPYHSLSSGRRESLWQAAVPTSAGLVVPIWQLGTLSASRPSRPGRETLLLLQIQSDDRLPTANGAWLVSTKQR